MREEPAHFFEHTIGFVEHENLDTVHVEAGGVADVVDETSGGGDDDVGALLELGLLNLERETTFGVGSRKSASAISAIQAQFTHQHRDRTEYRCNERERLQRREPAQPAHE